MTVLYLDSSAFVKVVVAEPESAQAYGAWISSGSTADTAAVLDPEIVRTLDAVHLATALALGDDVEAEVTYDERMIAGCGTLRLLVASPR